MAELPISHIDKVPLQDHCGIVGIFSSEDYPLLETGYQALLTLQTRGYDGAGFWAINSQNQELSYKGQGSIRSALSKQINKNKDQNIKVALFQTRYGTSGDQNLDNVQPLRLTHQATGSILSLAHNGQFLHTNQTSGSKQALANWKKTGLSDTVFFAQQLSESLNKDSQLKEHSLSQNIQDLDDLIVKIVSRQRGAFSLLIATTTALYACRDNLGIRPLVYGQINHKKYKQWIVTSETSAITVANANHVKEILPGQIIKISNQGIQELKPPTKSTKSAYCIFENVYIMDQNSKAHLPAKSADSIRSHPDINQVRFRSGQILAREAPLTRRQVDLVIGVPGTGITGGQGFANILKLPYVQAISDRQTPLDEQRTFMSADISEISQKVLTHFEIEGSMLIGKNICLVDDSLVRGNVINGIIKLLKKHFGVKKIHVRILCPPIDKPCYLGINTRESSELIVHQHRGDLNAVRRQIGANSLAYISTSGLKEAITNNSKAGGFCMGCMKGNLPPLARHHQRPVAKPPAPAISVVVPHSLNIHQSI
jgi:amidophosphoribosyltransferase